MEDNGSSTTVITTKSSAYQEFENFAPVAGSYHKHFLRTLPGLLIVAEIVLGLLVWALIAGTEYFLVSLFGLVMFVAVFYWILTLFLLVTLLSMAHQHIPHVPWTTVFLVFNCSASMLYLLAAIVEATQMGSGIKGHHDYYSWAASTFFAFLVSLCYAGSTLFSFKAWQNRQDGH